MSKVNDLTLGVIQKLEREFAGKKRLDEGEVKQLVKDFFDTDNNGTIDIRDGKNQMRALQQLLNSNLIRDPRISAELAKTLTELQTQLLKQMASAPGKPPLPALDLKIGGEDFTGKLNLPPTGMDNFLNNQISLQRSLDMDESKSNANFAEDTIKQFLPPSVKYEDATKEQKAEALVKGFWENADCDESGQAAHMFRMSEFKSAFQLAESMDADKEDFKKAFITKMGNYINDNFKTNDEKKALLQSLLASVGSTSENGMKEVKGFAEEVGLALCEKFFPATADGTVLVAFNGETSGVDSLAFVHAGGKFHMLKFGNGNDICMIDFSIKADPIAPGAGGPAGATPGAASTGVDKNKLQEENKQLGGDIANSSSDFADDNLDALLKITQADIPAFIMKGDIESIENLISAYETILNHDDIKAKPDLAKRITEMINKLKLMLEDANTLEEMKNGMLDKNDPLVQNALVTRIITEEDFKPLLDLTLNNDPIKTGEALSKLKEIKAGTPDLDLLAKLEKLEAHLPKLAVAKEKAILTSATKNVLENKDLFELIGKHKIGGKPLILVNSFNGLKLLMNTPDDAISDKSLITSGQLKILGNAIANDDSLSTDVKVKLISEINKINDVLLTAQINSLLSDVIQKIPDKKDEIAKLNLTSIKLNDPSEVTLAINKLNILTGIITGSTLDPAEQATLTGTINVFKGGFLVPKELNLNNIQGDFTAIITDPNTRPDIKILLQEVKNKIPDLVDKPEIRIEVLDELTKYSKTFPAGVPIRLTSAIDSLKEFIQ